MQLAGVRSFLLPGVRVSFAWFAVAKGLPLVCILGGIPLK